MKLLTGFFVFCLVCPFFVLGSCDVILEYKDWISGNHIVFHDGVLLNEHGMLMTEKSITERMTIVDIPDELFFGLHESNEEFVDEELEVKLLEDNLLRCYLDDNYDSKWKPFCMFIFHVNYIDISKNIPAILWENEYLELLEGTYLQERVSGDIERIKKRIDSFSSKFPNLKNPSFEDVFIAERVIENDASRIIHNKQYKLVLSPIFATLPSVKESETYLGYIQKRSKAGMWVDTPYKENDIINKQYGNQPNWRLLEYQGFFEPENSNLENRLPLDVYIKGFDKLYDEKIKLLKEAKNLPENEYPLSDKYYFINADATFSDSLIQLLRIKNHKGTLHNFDITKKGIVHDESGIYKSIAQILRSRLEEEYPTTETQDQQEFERRSTFEDPIKFKAIGIKIEEKKLVSAALRRAEHLEKSLIGEKMKQNQRKTPGKEERVIANKDLV